VVYEPSMSSQSPRSNCSISPGSQRVAGDEVVNDREQVELGADVEWRRGRHGQLLLEMQPSVGRDRRRRGRALAGRSAVSPEPGTAAATIGSMPSGIGTP
jgi:hypothetical protein